MLPLLHLITCCFHSFYKSCEIFGTVGDSSIDIITDGLPYSLAFCIFGAFVSFRIRPGCNNRKTVFQADQVAHPLESKAGKPEVPEFFSAVHGNRIIQNMIVNMGPVCVRCDDEGKLPLGEPHGKFTAEAVCFLGTYFAWLE